MTLQATLSQPRAERTTTSTVAALTVLLGLVLRVASARGDLWIDEIWTLNLLTTIGSPDQIFWNISHDNNHFLNSLWMYVVGLDGTPLFYRLPSILIGGFSVMAAFRIGLRSGPPHAAIVAAFVFAIAIPFVNYGSEARGYAGLVLALLVAIHALDQALATDASNPKPTAWNRCRWTFAVAVGLGTLSHLTMLLGAAILGCIVIIEAARRPGLRWPEKLRFLFGFFYPTPLLLLPAATAVGAGILVHGRITIGGLSYAPDRFLTGLGGMAGATLGMPVTTPPWIPLVTACAAVLLAWRANLLAPHRATMAGVGLVAVPILVAVVNPPNTDYPRYFLVLSVMLALMLAEACGRALATSAGRYLAPILIAAFTAGQLYQDAQLVLYGRGNVSRIVAEIAHKPGSSYAAPFSTAFQLAMNYQTYRADVVVDRIPLPLTCNVRPEWYIADASPGSELPAETLTLGPNTCPMTFTQVLDLPTSSLSGRHWTLFEKRPE